MALQSQTPRAPQRLVPVSSSSSGLSSKAKLAIGGVGVVAIGAAAVLAFKLGFSGASPAPASAEPGVTDPLNVPPAASAAHTPPSGTDTAQANPPKPPATIQMGRQDAAALVPPPAGTPGMTPEATPGSTPGSVPSVPGADGGLVPAPTGTGAGPTAPPGGPESAAPLAPPEPPAMSEGRRLMEQAARAQAEGRQVEARALLNRVLLDGRIPANERGAVRQQIAALNESLVFGTAVGKGDPFCDVYTVASGDSLVSIRAKQSLPIDWRLLQRINKVNPNALRVGQKLKLVRVPFHAVVRKSEYRLDLYMGDPPTPTSTSAGPDGQDPSWTFVRAFPVGLGEGNGTPEGTFVVRPRSKLVNPHWVNPRTGERFGADDPKNPIGEYWIGLEGADEASKKFTSYGLHGTIDPSSIGASKSMGCVRMAADDIALMFEVLAERVSTVRIVR